MCVLGHVRQRWSNPSSPQLEVWYPMIPADRTCRKLFPNERERPAGLGEGRVDAPVIGVVWNDGADPLPPSLDSVRSGRPAPFLR